MTTGNMTSNNRPSTSRLIRRIGLWGAPTSGKTTFLAALNVAVTQSRHDWTLVGINDKSVDFLTQSTTTLTDRRRFPEASESLTELSWVMMSEKEERIGSRWRRKTVRVPLELHLDLLDAPGGFFKSESPEARAARADLGYADDDDGDEVRSDPESLIDSLSESDGIVYLFDPIMERETGDSYQYFHGMLEQIKLRAHENGRFKGNRLPHYLAVCITKFDDPRVFLTARRRNYLTFDDDDDHLFPRVHEDSVENLFEDLCSVSPTNGAALVRQGIRSNFHESRVRYFATSSVGFYLGRSTRFRMSDFQSVVPDGSQGYKIRGDIYPINVLEPLLWLGQQLTGPANG